MITIRRTGFVWEAYRDGAWLGIGGADRGEVKRRAEQEARSGETVKIVSETNVGDTFQLDP